MAPAARRHPSLKALLLTAPSWPGWADRTMHTALFPAAVTVGEILAGIELTRDQHPARAAELDEWLAQVADSFNILPMDAAAFRAWARLMHPRQERLIEDAMIAATALIHGLTVVTRNLRDFQPFGVALLDPFAAGTGAEPAVPCPPSRRDRAVSRSPRGSVQ